MEKEDNSNSVIIDDKEYKIEDFTKEQTYQVDKLETYKLNLIIFVFKLINCKQLKKHFQVRL